MKKNLKIVIILSLTYLLSGCATIFSGTTQSITVQAVDFADNKVLDHVQCSLTDSNGVYHNIVGNPGTVVISKGSGAITPRCNKEGYIQKNFGVGNSFNTISIANVLFWPGFIVDGMTGAMHKYPSHMTVIMERK